MKEKLPSHFSELRKVQTTFDDLHAEGFLVSEIELLSTRNDPKSVFEREHTFSGVEKSDGVETCLTIPSSPHVAVSVPKERLLVAAEKVLGHAPELPTALKSRQEVPPHIILWWQGSGLDHKSPDFSGLSTLSETERKNFCVAMGKQTERAVRIIESMTSNARVMGAWGHATPEDRRSTGMGRGVPSNPRGHIHINSFDISAQKLSLRKNLTAAEKSNHYGPWETIFHEQFAVPLARIISGISQDVFSDGNVSVDSISEFRKNDRGGTGGNFGFEISFTSERTIEQVYLLLAKLAGDVESIYQTFTKHFEEYHTHRTDKNHADSVVENAKKYCTSIGFTAEDAGSLVNFLMRIRPSYTQLENWIALEANISPDDLVALKEQKARYEKVLAKMGTDTSRDSLDQTLVRGTLTPLSERLWPVHSSIGFMIDRMTIESSKVAVHGIKLFLGIVSQESAMERENQVILKR